MQKSEKRNIVQSFRNCFYMLGIVWRFDRKRVILVVASRLLDFGFWVFETVVFMRYLVSAADMNRSFGQVALFVCLTVAAWMLSQLFSAWLESRFLPISDIRLHRAVNQLIFAKAANVELQCYEDAEFFTSYTKSSGEAFARAVGAVENTASLIASICSSVFVIVNIFSINYVIGLASVLPLAVNIVMGMKAGQKDYRKKMEQVPCTRRQDYVSRAVYLQKYAKELRLTGFFEVLKDIYGKATEEHIGVTRKHWKKIAAFDLIKGLICYPIFFEGSWLLAAYFAMVVRSVSLSDFVVLANSAVSATWMLFSVTDSLVAIFNGALYTDNLRAFLEYREKIPEDRRGLDVPGRIDTLELKDVSFQYKLGREFVLRDVNMVLERGKIVSLVGPNGSGKSTLVKLLMRLYDPTHGQILLNGIDIREFDLRQYRALFATTFQDFQIFSSSVLDNVVMGNETCGDPRAAAREALERSTVLGRIEVLERGLDSTLLKEFDEDGVQLSTGEQQKVAIARAFAKESSILVLDEPSSALDPIAEYHIHQNFIRMCSREAGDDGAGKLSVFISHRMSTAAVADRIYLLENGSIIESGPHRRLMERDAAYAEMYRKQSQNYVFGGEGE